MERLSMFLEGFASGSIIKLISINGNLLYEGPKEDIPHKYEDRVNIILGSVKIGNKVVEIGISYDDSDDNYK